ncbi:MAG: cysteine hydrolase [Candidatus Binataceae bacterium]|nr:cysteine hydrolase [Candidatus Binataceae bacterium]
MTTLKIDPETTVLLPLDVQTDFVELTPGVKGAMLERMAQVIDRCRDRKVPIVYVTVSYRWPEYEAPATVPLLKMVREQEVVRAGMPGTAIHSALRPQPDEPVLNKTSIDPFLTTGLLPILNSLRASTLVLFGLQTNYVVEATARHAADLGYRVVILRDCCASASQDMHDFAMDRILPGLVDSIITAEEFIAALTGK